LDTIGKGTDNIIWIPKTQHIIDEEATTLKILLEAYGRQGAENAIKVFQKHREIHP